MTASPRRRLTGKIVLATHNAGKLEEIRAVLAPFGIDLVSSGALGLPEPEENGFMFSDNAAIKARAAATATGLPVIADDSGLCVDVLDGAPGLFTADWAGKPRSFPRAFDRLKYELERRQEAANGAKAHFTASMVVVFPDGAEMVFEGRCHGTLTFPPRGQDGHGYDPIFTPQGYDRTFAEMTMDEKNALSHRGKALEKLIKGLLA